ncbi:hypothetical protein NQ314_009769 [Rhamnusium bicolor]|uniref:Uncharacterized protein n=1 Tax=Rhamnusium bicolor TaxID=1586634 RepID=A0AAV8XWI6_9CUCU|nr:hypothetical protein NQ314_009769 [Rhamnusium bicolor]
MEKSCLQKIEKEREKVTLKHDELQCLRKLLCEEEGKIFSETQQKMPCSCKKGHTNFHKYLMANIHCCCSKSDQGHLSKEQEKYVRQYTELLKYKYRIKELKNKDELSADVEDRILRKYQKKLDEEIDKVLQ